uniref:Macrophage mannose receptor 1-like n=2 Tax=Erpetoichthys calabaricus TaxID=27687 RepID=A0A8C4RTX3_ERPCA
MKQFPRKEVSIIILFLLTCRGLNLSVLNVVSNVMVWHKAFNYCRNDSSDAAAVAAVNQLMLKLNISGKDNFCTDLSFYEVKWQWSNKDEVTYSNWKRDFFCGFVQSDGTWNDSVCYDQKPFMCYQENSNINERYVWINSRMNWSSAQNYCQVNYTDLVSIRNENENQQIMEKAQGSPFWIGLFNNPWKWSDGENSIFQIWTQNQPDNYLRNEACVEILSDGSWNDDFCGKKNYFFCTNKSKVTTSFDLVEYSLSWLDAQRYCRANYTDLMTVENQTENQKLQKPPQDQGYWIGLSHENDNWQWSNKSPLTYTNWRREFSCAVLQSDGSWNDSDCSEEKPFMCYNEMEYIRTYIWINERMNWTRAQNYCRMNYKDLVSIRDESENEEIRNKAQNSPFWIGLFNNSRKWSDGDKSTLTSNSNQSQLPDNEQHPENCTEVKINGCCVITQYSTEKHLICSQ